jgi:hypothetical protein
MERADSVRLLSINKQFRQDPGSTANTNSTNESQRQATFNDANDDDEVREINSGKENQENTYISTSNSKPGLLPDAQTKAFNSKLNLGLPQPGTFSDPHDGQKHSLNSDRNSSVSTQQDLPSADVFHKSSSGGNIASFEPINESGIQYSSAFIDQQAAKSIGKEKI